MEKVTKRTFNYPAGEEPDTIIPKECCKYRYVIGRHGANPLIAICMNPSAARDSASDRTVNKIIISAKQLGYDGWFVINSYPERATDTKNLDKFAPILVENNINEARKLLKLYNVKEVWGAWGDPTCEHITMGCIAMKALLKEMGVKVFAFKINKSGNPKHPLYLKVDASQKVYVSL